MTTVFTRKNKYPRTTTLLDFRNFGNRDAPQLRVLSPTRLSNPHPIGLNHQNIPSTSSYLIWHPDLARKAGRYPDMMRHTRHVNFSCKHPEKLESLKKSGETHLPDIRYTENTISRESYINPARYKLLTSELSSHKAMVNPDKKAVQGIVPNLLVKQYLPVIDR
ncbi:hypothetical protein ACF0H5_021205 [Mactra antiquata]